MRKQKKINAIITNLEQIVINARDTLKKNRVNPELFLVFCRFCQAATLNTIAVPYYYSFFFSHENQPAAQPAPPQASTGCKL